MILAIDVGNSRLKWGVFDTDGELRAHGNCPTTELIEASPVAWSACKRAVISNVAGVMVAEKLNAMLQTLGIPAHWVAASPQACGVKNSYTQPQQLGADRWAALIAAWRHYHAPCIVVNAGTALTIDALGADKVAGRGIFLGGLIVPGFNLMQTNLMQGTAGIGTLPGSSQEFPTNTGDAIYTGSLSAMVGAVESMMDKLQQHEAQLPRCVVSGGDATLLAEALKGSKMANNVVIADNLVLQGLLELERESA